MPQTTRSCDLPDLEVVGHFEFEKGPLPKIHSTILSIQLSCLAV